jgi:5'-deoxynucleotidase YfbR-like HD superfamily hydrolase
MIDLRVLQNISNIQRFSGDFLFHPENISTHSLEMCILCLNFSQLVPESDAGEMCIRCVLHDLDESIASDVPRYLKYADKDLKNLVSKISLKLLEPYVDSDILYKVKTAKDMDNINGFLVGLADRMQCFFKIAKEYKYYGNKSLEEDYNNLIDSMCSIKNSIKEYPKISNKSKINLINHIDHIINFY